MDQNDDDTDTCKLAQQLRELNALLPQLSAHVQQTQATCSAAIETLTANGFERMERADSGFGHREAVSSILRWREARRRFLPEDWFSDPAWDILLRLYEAHLHEQERSVGDLGSFAATSPATTNRWLDALMSRGWILRRRDERDQRRVFVSLSESGLAKMHDYFESMRRPD